MNNDWNKLYDEIILKNINDYNSFLVYYLELFENNNFGSIKLERDSIDNFMKNELKIDEKDYNIYHLWYCIESLHNNDNNWIEHPFLYQFKNKMISIADKLTEKANNMEKEYKDFYKQSKYFCSLKNFVFDLISNNKLGLTISDISNNIDSNISSKEKDINDVINILILENKIKKLDGSNPSIYYLNNYQNNNIMY